MKFSKHTVIRKIFPLTLFLLFAYYSPVAFAIPEKNLADIAGAFTSLVNLMSGVGGGVFVIMVAIAAIKYGLAQGDPKGVQGAKDTLTLAIVGFIIVIGFYVIMSIVFKLVGVSSNLLQPGNALRDAINDLMGELNSAAGGGGSFHGGGGGVK